jgi:hypothetical protein
MDKIALDTMARMASPEITGALAVIKQTLGYDLPPSDRQSFLYFHSFVTTPQPEFITAWRADLRLEKWYHRFVNGFLGDVQNSLGCVLYHAGRIAELEAAVLNGIDRFKYREVLGPSSAVGVGNTLKWDFEYQAFVLSYRRCLDSLARAICTYFRNDFHSFRGLGGQLRKLKPEVITEPLATLHAEHVDNFRFVLSEGDRKSVRDRISHYEYVSAGSLNLNHRGLMVLGGGENLGFGPPHQAVLLSTMMDDHVKNLRSCVHQMIVRFVDCARIVEASQAK